MCKEIEFNLGGFTGDIISALESKGYLYLEDREFISGVEHVYIKDNIEYVVTYYDFFNTDIYKVKLIPECNYEENYVKNTINKLKEKYLNEEMTFEEFDQEVVPSDSSVFNYEEDEIEASFVIFKGNVEVLFDYEIISRDENIKNTVIKIKNISEV